MLTRDKNTERLWHGQSRKWAISKQGATRKTKAMFHYKQFRGFSGIYARKLLEKNSLIGSNRADLFSTTGQFLHCHATFHTGCRHTSSIRPGVKVINVSSQRTGITITTSTWRQRALKRLLWRMCQHVPVSRWIHTDTQLLFNTADTLHAQMH